MNKLQTLLATSLLSLTGAANADWHYGKVNSLLIGYDGKTIQIRQDGFTRSDCTCYTPWPNGYCMDPTRDTHKDELAIILSAKARNASLAFNIDETTCKIRAMYEA
jgi:hypothetical protein